MDSALLAGLMLPALFALIALGIPVGPALMVTAAGFSLPAFGDIAGRQILGRLIEVGTNFVLVSVPAFVLMGHILERSGIAERLFAALRILMGRLPGGLALAAIVMAAVFSACTGTIGAVEITVGVMAMPAMLARGYDKGLIAGTIGAGGSLGPIIPPSITAVIYGLVAQVPISALLAGLWLPGLLMTGLFLAAIVLRAIRDPAAAPREPPEPMPLGRKLAIIAGGLLPASLLIVAVLGAIFAGIASPTEAAATGVLGAVLLAAAYRTLTWRMLREALNATALNTGMIMTIVLGGTLFAGVFTLHGGGALVRALIDAFDPGPSGLVLTLLGIVLLLGLVLDWATTVLLCVPVFRPLLQAAGVDELWFGVLMLTAIQTSYLVPPLGPAIFYLQSVAPKEITYTDIVKGVLPFHVCQLLTLAAVFLVPALATWLPEALRRF